MRRLPLRLVLIVAGSVFLSGCTATAPDAGAPTTSSTVAPSASPITTPTAEVPVPTIATVSIGATGVDTLDDAGQVIDSAVYADGPDALIAFLTDAIGSEPVAERDGDSEDSCAAPSTILRWGDEVSVTKRDVESPPLYNSAVTVRAGETDTGIRLESSTGFAVGDDGAAILATLPADQYINEYNDSTGPLLFEVSGTDDAGKAYGAAALVGTDGLVSAITAPASLSAFYC